MIIRKISKVFVAGGQPTVTYVDRNEFRLETSLSEALEAGYALISITGATKSGKTVLCKNVIQNGIWIGGGEIANEDDFWNRIVDELDGFTEESESAHISRTNGETSQTSGELTAVFAKTSGTEIRLESKQSTKVETRTRKNSSKSTALDLLSRCERVVVIDDFHYIDAQVQRTIVRSLKQKIFDGLRVAVLAVPHRAYDAAKVETEMTGRIKQIEIPKWEKGELQEIAVRGFRDLKLVCSADIIDLFCRQSFASPHLMQWFCHKICGENKVQDNFDDEIILYLRNQDQFFGDVARNTSKPAFDRLARGPRQRSDRIIRSFSDGTRGDIYIAILKAIAATGPKLTMTYEDIRSKLKEIIDGDAPQAHEIGRVLVKMTEIARSIKQGEAVLEWEDEILHVIDPFFAFYLRWGVLERPGSA